MHMLLPSLLECEPFRFTYTLWFLYKCFTGFSHLCYTLGNCYSTRNISHSRMFAAVVISFLNFHLRLKVALVFGAGWFYHGLCMCQRVIRDTNPCEAQHLAFVIYNILHRECRCLRFHPSCVVLSLFARLPRVTIRRLAKSRMATVWTVFSAIRMK